VRGDGAWLIGGIAVIEQSVLGLHEVDEMQVAVVGGKGSTASACRLAFV
jgi:hypothetical protein